MKAEEFVAAFKEEKEGLSKLYLQGKDETGVSSIIKSMNLNSEQTGQMGTLIDAALTDAFYTILLGLDGCCSIGGALQQKFSLKDENGQEVSGDIESAAYQIFQEE